MPDDVFAKLKQRAAAYRDLTDAYDQALLAAHKAGHGTPAALEHLRKANAIAPDVMTALKDYQAAVAALAWHLGQPPPSKRTASSRSSASSRSRRTGAISRKRRRR